MTESREEDKDAFREMPCRLQRPAAFDWGCGWPGGPMICSATRSFMFWRMKASSK